MAGAMASTGALVAWLASQLWSQATRPIVEQLKNERESREMSDSLIVRMIRDTREVSYRQRIDLLDVLGYPLGPARNQRIESIRERIKEER